MYCCRSQTDCYYKNAIRVSAEKAKIFAVGFIDELDAKKVVISEPVEIHDSMYTCYGTAYVRTKKRADLLNAM